MPGGNPVSGVMVTFTAPGSGASGTFANGTATTTATTNASGVATSSTFMANATAGGPYNVVASAAGTTSVNFSLTDLASASTITLVQHTNKDAGTTTSSTLAFASSNTAGNWIAVVIRAGGSSAQVLTVSDSNGNTYHQAFEFGTTANPISMAIYYAENINGGANTVTVSDTVSGPLRFVILEYSGVATSNSLDLASTGQGLSTSPNSGSLTTSANGDLLLGAVVTNASATITAGTGYTIEEFVPAEPSTKLIAEDQIQPAAGFVSAGATLAASDNWGAGLAAFKPPAGVPGVPASVTATGGITQSATVNTAFGTPLQATVKDSFNNPVSGVTVTFRAPASAASGTFANGTDSITATTNATGVATSSTFTANTTAGGPYTVTASAAGVATATNFSLTNLAGAAASITATGGTPQSAGINTAFPTQLQATVSDAWNNPVGGVTVTFTAPGNGASGTFANGTTSTTATTDGQGLATATVFTANATIGGPYTVTASASGISTPASFSLTNLASPPPNISSLSLTQGPVGATLTVHGTNFGSPQGSSSVTFNGVTGAVVTWNTSNIDVTVPSGATTGNVVVTVAGVASNGVNFTVTPPPNITSISPTSGPIGTVVTVTGTDFGPTIGTIQSVIKFNGVQTRTTFWSDTSAVGPVPSGATTGDVVLYVGGAPSNGVLFTVTPPPSITSLSPNFGPVGASVTITGSYFGATQGTSTVTFNGVQATPTSWSDTSIAVPVPRGATTGNVVVTESGLASNSVNFTVTSNNISLVQHRSIDAGPFTGSLAFVSPNTAGNWIAIVVRGGNSNNQAFTVSDSNGNTYLRAFRLGLSGAQDTFSLYYAENIKAGANTITVSMNVAGPLRFAILEYSNVATSNSLDAAVTAQGTGTTPNSTSLTTTAGGELLLGEIITNNPDAFTATGGYVIEESVPTEPNSKLVVEDQLQAAAGSASAGATLTLSDFWGAGLAALPLQFRHSTAYHCQCFAFDDLRPIRLRNASLYRYCK